jgi:hypothetical protein
MKGMSMKFTKLLIIVFAILMISGCSDDVSTIKNGTLEFDKSITVGQAFDKYKYFSSTKWKSFSTDNGRKIVEVKGDFKNEYLKHMRWEDQFASASLLVKFTINKDDTFEISALALDFLTRNGDKKRQDIGANLTARQLNTLLSELYNNKPIS